MVSFSVFNLTKTKQIAATTCFHSNDTPVGIFYYQQYYRDFKALNLPRNNRYGYSAHVHEQKKDC